MRRIEKLLKDRSQKVRLSYLLVYLQMKTTRLKSQLSNLLTSFHRKVAKINNPTEKKFKNTLKMNCSKG